MADAKSAMEKRYNMLKWPLVGGSLLIASLNSPLMNAAKEWKWFDYHPYAMAISFIMLSGIATLLKKIGGYENTKTHGMLFSAATALGGFGLYVIYSNKDMLNKPHFATLHGKLGLASYLAYVGLNLVGGAALHPDWGILKTNKSLRAIHKYSGRAALMLSWGAAYTGFTNLEADTMKTSAVAIYLGILSYFMW